MSNSGFATPTGQGRYVDQNLYNYFVRIRLRRPSEALQRPVARLLLPASARGEKGVQVRGRPE